MTDGVTEAAQPGGEEFGEQRVALAALRAQADGAHAIRTQILEEVTAFCGGDFHDDASLMVLVVN
jgi:serine phosphatase RsbU (regulator of sigma subunit)